MLPLKQETGVFRYEGTLYLAYDDGTAKPLGDVETIVENAHQRTSPQREWDWRCGGCGNMTVDQVEEPTGACLRCGSLSWVRESRILSDEDYGGDHE